MKFIGKKNKTSIGLVAAEITDINFSRADGKSTSIEAISPTTRYLLNCPGREHISVETSTKFINDIMTKDFVNLDDYGLVVIVDESIIQKEIRVVNDWNDYEGKAIPLKVAIVDDPDDDEEYDDDEDMEECQDEDEEEEDNDITARYPYAMVLSIIKEALQNSMYLKAGEALENQSKENAAKIAELLNNGSDMLYDIAYAHTDGDVSPELFEIIAYMCSLSEETEYKGLRACSIIMASSLKSEK